MALATGVEVEVEVRSSSEGFYYLAAVVVRSHPNVRRYTVSYASSTSASNLQRETVDAARVRPRPPNPTSSSSSAPLFCLHDAVDAFRDGAWWPGVVVGLASGSSSRFLSPSPNVSVSVCFPLRREVVPFASSLIRPHLEWLSARWVPPHLLEMPSSIFDRGAKVEVAQIKDFDSSGSSAWFPAVVTQRIWENNYLVCYSHFTTQTGSASIPIPVQEIVHLSHLRPRPCRACAIFFCVNDPVEAFYGRGWHPGTVLKVSQGQLPIYAVRLPHLDEEMVFQQLHLRPCFDWLHGRWLSS